MSYSLAPGFRVPAVQRGLSPVEALMTKVNAGAGSALVLSGMVTAAPPPVWALGAVGAAAAVVNMSPGPRSIARWATVGYRYWREREVPAAMTDDRSGASATWALYPGHGTMQDPVSRAAFHQAVGRALVFASAQARNAGIQVHVTHHATVDDGYTDHMQTISVHVPKNLVGHPKRVLDTLESEFARLGSLTPLAPEPVPAVVERGAGWVGLDGGRYAATARITGWPAETGGDLMVKVLLGEGVVDARNDHFGRDRSFAVLYRPLPVKQSRRSERIADAANAVFNRDKIQAAADQATSDTRQSALVQGDTHVDVDAYMTVWGDSPEDVTQARWNAGLMADRHRITLDWCTGQQHRAHVMTTPHAAATRKGAVL